MMLRIQAAAHRQQHQTLGEAVRWFKALHCRCYNPLTGACDPSCPYGHDANGLIYSEQAIDPAYKALISQTSQPMVDPTYGLIQVGSLRISVMPDEIPLSRLDHVILIERQLVARPVLVRGSGTALDLLPNTPVAGVQRVTQNDTVYAVGVDWQLNADRIESLAGGQQPAASTRYTVEYTYHPTFAFLGLEENASRPDAAGTLLPLRGVLALITTA